MDESRPRHGRNGDVMCKLVYIAVGGILGIALSGGAAVAGGLIHGKDLAKGTITSRELGAKSVTGAKLSKSLKQQLSKSGSAGSAGPAGPAGAAGARGPAGGFNFVDQNGTVVGESVGFYSGVYPMVRLGDGTILTYDNDPANSNAVPLISSIYYSQAGCAGTGYAYTGGGVPFQTAIITVSPAIPGSQIYKQVAGTPQNFTAASVKNSAGCSASTTAITRAFAVTEAGKVPATAKPFVLKAVG